MFLKLDGATGESDDDAHKDEIEVVSWKWGLEAPKSVSGGAGGHGGATTMTDMLIVKRADKATTALMSFLRANKIVGRALLTVRKAGPDSAPLEYMTVSLEKVRIASISVTADEPTGGGPPQVLEHVALSFGRVTVNYKSQSKSGSGAGTCTFMADAHVGS